MTTYTIGSGETYPTFADLIASVTLGPGDIVQGKDETFSEDWTPNGSGAGGNILTLQQATLDANGAESYGVYLSSRQYIQSILHIYDATIAGVRIIAGNNNTIGPTSGPTKYNIDACDRGVYIDGSAINMNLRYLNITDCDSAGIDIRNSSYSGILYCDISGTLNNNPGIYLLNFTAGTVGNTITAVTSNNNTGTGLYADLSCLRFSTCDFNDNGNRGLEIIDGLPLATGLEIFRVEALRNTAYGARLVRCDDFLISRLTANDNIQFEGIKIEDSDDLGLSRLTAHRNGQHGIWLVDCNDAVADNMDANENDDYGIWISGLRFTGTDIIANLNGSIGVNIDSTDFSLDEVTAETNGSDGIYVATGSDTGEIKNANVNNNTGAGISVVNSDDITIEDGFFAGNDADGINSDSTSDRTKIIRCLGEWNQDSGIVLAGLDQLVEYSCLAYNGGNNDGIHLNVDNTTGLLHNLTLFNNFLHNIYLNGAGLNFDIRNCIITTGWDEQTFWFMSIDDIGNTVTCDYNCYWVYDPAFNILTDTPFIHNGAQKTWAQWQSAGFDANSIFLDPQFVNPSLEDFTLSYTSPCLDVGDFSTVTVGDTYLDGTVVDDSTVNMGAYSGQGQQGVIGGGFTFKFADSKFDPSQGEYNARRFRR